MDTPTYLSHLNALTTLGLPLTKVPPGVTTTIELQCALKDMEVALLRVRIAVTKQELGQP